MNTATAIIVPALALVILFFSMTLLRMVRTWNTERAKQIPRGDDSRRIQLEDAKDRVLTNLRDLDFEYRMGKLSDSDYKELKERSELEAVEVLQALDELP
jgi:hypothetical protein